MKVVAVDTVVVNARLRNWVFVKVATDEPGLVGWSEASLGWKTRAVVGAVEDSAGLVVGEDPLRTEHHWQAMFRQQFFRGSIVTMSALAASTKLSTTSRRRRSAYRCTSCSAAASATVCASTTTSAAETAPPSTTRQRRLVTRWEFRELFDKRACAIAQPDVCHCGGVSEVKRIAAMAETAFVSLAPHNPLGPIATAVNVHVALSTPNFSSRR